MKGTAAALLADCLIEQGVERVFAIPGAKIDALFDVLKDTDIDIIVCRHEQNAAFMAASYGRLTGKPGVVVVTSGPGVSNLATGLLTATTEGDPVIAIGGNVPRSMKFKESHQSADNVALMKAATKYSVEVSVAENIPEIIENAFRMSTLPRAGASFISVPQDILCEQTTIKPNRKVPPIEYGAARSEQLNAIASSIENATCPVLFLGEEASRPNVCKAVRQLLSHHAIATINTYQAAGVLSRELSHLFAGRVGLFKNQPGDRLLDKADLVITVGFNPVEYDPEIWNKDGKKHIIHIDYNPCDIHTAYLPQRECLGAIDENLMALAQRLPQKERLSDQSEVNEMGESIKDALASGEHLNGMPIHPLRFVYELRSFVDDDTLVISDIGSHGIWLSRYYWTYNPRHLLVSNGQQTLGVALPWAIGAHYANPQQKIISLSGDGGFLFSAVEIETAVREKINFTHIVWHDGYYNMVKEQQLLKYGRDSAVKLGSVDYVKFAESFGATGLKVNHPDNIRSVLEQAQKTPGPVLIDVAIDYSDNPPLFETLHEHAFD